MDINESAISILENLSDRIGQLYSHFDDPTGVKTALLPAFSELIGKVNEDQQLSYENKLLFLAQMIDARKSKNMVDVVKKALPLLSEKADFRKIDDDWLFDFFDKTSKSNSEQFQALWARILATEADKPGTISKRLLHNLFIMSKQNAEDFVSLSLFCFYDRYDSTIHAMVFSKEPIFALSSLTTGALKELEQLSLIELNYDGFSIPNRIHLMYMNHYIQLDAKRIPAGVVRLTADGMALFNVIEKMNSRMVLESTLEIMKKNGVAVIIAK